MKVNSRLPKWCYHLLTLRFCQVPIGNLYWHNTLKFFQYCLRNLDSSGVSKPSNSRSIEYTVRAKGCLSLYALWASGFCFVYHHNTWKLRGSCNSKRNRSLLNGEFRYQVLKVKNSYIYVGGICTKSQSEIVGFYSRYTHPVYSDESGHWFQSIPDTHSNRKRTPIPKQSGHPQIGAKRRWKTCEC